MVGLTLPTQVLRGVYLGMLTGVIPALIAFGFGFTFRYVTGVTIPAFAVIVFTLGLAGVNGGLMALADPTITQQANSVTLMTAVVIVLMLSLYTHAQGDKLATTIPRHLTFTRLRESTVSKDVIDFVGGRGHVQVEILEPIRDMEEYPPIPESLRAEMQESTYSFPADLPLSELESRLAERLRSEFDLQEVHVSMDEQGRAAVTAAPRSAGVSSRLSPGNRAVSFDALIPTGIARGDVVSILAGNSSIEGTVVSARSGPRRSETPAVTERMDSETESVGPTQTRAPTTTGGEGRITVSVPSTRVDELLKTSVPRLVVRSRGIRREFELISLLRRSGQRIRRFTIGQTNPVSGRTIGEASLRDTYGVAILALRTEGEWVIGPRGGARLEAGTEVFAVGSVPALTEFGEVVAE